MKSIYSFITMCLVALVFYSASAQQIELPAIPGNPTEAPATPTPPNLEAPEATTTPSENVPTQPDATATPTQQPAEATPPAPVVKKAPIKPYLDDKFIVIGTGAITGIYYPSGGAVCRLMNRARKTLGIRCAVESTPGSIYNLNALRSAEIDFGIVQSDWQEHAFNGTGPFKKQGRQDGLRFLFSLHNEAFTVIVSKKSTIEEFDDIRGHIVNIGHEGSGVRATMEELMKAKGWTKTDFQTVSELKPTEQAKALCDGKIDVMILATGHPNGAVQEVVNMCETRIIDVDDQEIQKFVRSNPEFSMTTIPGGIYAGSPRDIRTFGVKATVVTTSDTSEDMAFNITKVVFDNLQSFKKLHPVFAQLTAERMIREGRTAPYHPGALRYYRKRGWVQ